MMMSAACDYGRAGKLRAVKSSFAAPGKIMFILMKRRLNDYDAWKKVVSDLDGLRAQYGSRGFTAYRSAVDPNEVYLVFDWEDNKPYTEYLNLPDVKKALVASGTMEIIEISEVFQLPE
jgi:quinol monooxygenase YgiN